MRIAHVSATFPPYWGGTGNVAYENAAALTEMGHAVSVFTGQQQPVNPPSFPFRVHYLRAWTRVGNAPFTPGLVSELGDFDLVHLHCPFILGAELTTLGSVLRRTPLVVTYHNDLRAAGIRGAAFAAYRVPNRVAVLRRARLVIVTSLDYAGESDLRHVRQSRIVELPNTVRTDVFTPGQPDRRILAGLGLAAVQPFALFVGALDAAHFFKGVPTLIDAMTRVPDLGLVVVGDGDLRRQFEELGRSRLGSRVHFAGRVSSESLPHLYRAASVTVLPSTTRGEAFGLVLLESMSCGTPVVASALPGVRTLVDPGKDGLLTPPGDSEALAGAIAAITASAERAQVMGREGHSKVARFYASSSLGSHLESIYANALGSGSPALTAETFPLARTS